MGKRSVVASALVIGLAILLSVASAGCRKKSPGAGAPPPPGPVAGDLRILGATPKGPTQAASEAARIAVIFDHPMTALEALPEPGAGPSLLRLEPPVEGRQRWAGTRALVFEPSQPLPPNTGFKATLPAGTRSIDGYALPRDFSWTFETPRPRVVRHFPYDGQGALRLDTEVLLVFNQPVSRSKSADRIRWIGSGPSGRDETVAFSARRPSADRLKEEGLRVPADRTLVLRSDDPLKVGFEYTVTIPEGFPGEAGGLGSDAPERFSFSTYRAFALDRFAPKDGHDPHQPLVFVFSNPVPYKEIAAKIRLEPPTPVPEHYAGWDQASEEIWLNLPLRPDTAYTVRLPADLRDEFGNALGREAVLSFRTSDFPPSLNMTTGHGVLEAYGGLRYPVSSVNVPSLRAQAARIPVDDAVPFFLTPQLFWSGKEIRPRGGAFDVDRTIALKTPRNERRVSPIDLRDVLPQGRGIVYLQVRPEIAGAPAWSRAVLQVTELGLSAKFSPENTLVWVTELKTGRPAPGVAVQLRDDRNRVLHEGAVDANGLLLAPGWRALGLRAPDEWSAPRLWVFARRGADAAFTSSDWDMGIAPYRFDVEFAWTAGQAPVEGYIFTDRGLYRAGETVRVKGILRRSEQGRWRLPKAARVGCEIRDPFGKSFLKTDAECDDFGSFALDVPTGAAAALGDYRVDATVPAEAEGEEPAVVSGNFRLDAFKPAEFEVLLRATKDAYVFGDDFEAVVRASYLSGGPLSGQPAKWFLRLNPNHYEPPGHPGFLFGNAMDWGAEEDGGGAESSRLLASGEQALDAQGSLTVKSRLLPEKERDSVAAVLEATVQSPGRASISNRVQAIVHRGEFYVGLKPSATFLRKDEAVTLDVIAADPSGALLAGRKVKVRLIRREWRSVRKAGVGGRFQWSSERIDTDVAAQAVSTSAGEPVRLTFKPDRSGMYLFAADASDGRRNPITTSVPFYVTGRDYVAWERSDDDRVELVPDRERYRPGDTARILVKSPYESAKALVTLERELVLDRRVLDIAGSTSEIAVPITAGLAPNAYVSVLLVQGRTAGPPAEGKDDAGKPSFKLGYARLAVDPEDRKLTVDVVADRPDYRPGGRVKLSFRVKDARGNPAPASLSVAVADLGVLNLIGFRSPDPFSRFYAPKPLSVTTSDTRLNVVGERAYGEKGEDAGGGGTDMAKSLAAPPGEVELRGDFRFTAFWEPSLRTAEDGTASLEFDLPDNLTTFRVMAAAQTKESSFGSGEATLKVTKPVQLLPSLPRFVRAGDEFEAGVVVHNFAAGGGKATLSLTCEGLACADPADRTFDIAAGGTKEVRFPFRAEAAGRARLSFRLRLGSESDGLEMAFPVQAPRPAETVALSGVTTDAAVEEVAVPAGAVPGGSRLDVSAAPTSLVGLKASLEYLQDYPYGCLEQRLSAILPYLVAPRLIADFGLSKTDPAAVRVTVESTLRDLPSFQKDSGGFTLWPDSPETAVSPYVTAYAAFAMLEAREAGYDVPDYRLERSLEYLRALQKTRQPLYGRKAWATTLAFAAYDLALAGKPDAALAERLFGARRDLPLFGRTLLFKALSRGDGSEAARATLRDELLNLVKISPTSAHFEEEIDPALAWIYSSNTRTTAAILQALVETGTAHPLLPQIVRWLVDARREGRWRTTQDNFFAFYALGDCYAAAEGTRPDFTYRISLGDRALLEGAFRAATEPVRSATADLTGLRGGDRLPLRFAKDGEGSLHYDARLSYVPAAAPPRDEGIGVTRRILSPDGKPLTVVAPGSLVMVEVETVVPQESLFVVVEDPLPAGFEAVNPRFLTESEEAQAALDRMGDRGGDGEDGEGAFDVDPFNHVEMRDDRVVLFADSLPAGVWTHRYLARATAYGSFRVPGPAASLMYEPEVFGRGAESVVAIGTKTGRASGGRSSD